MDNPSDALEILNELNTLRTRAKELRESGRSALKGIREVTADGIIKSNNEKDDNSYNTWIASDNKVETALLVKVQNHRDLSEHDIENDTAEASKQLKDKLENIELATLFPKTFEAKTDATVPVLIAARVMQALVRRAETVFSTATMICYYRIVRELYFAASPDWTIGAARAGSRGTTSAFVTNECIRAVLAFDSAIKRTVEFFKNTRELSERYNRLIAMLKESGIDPKTDHPLSRWTDIAIKRMWLDWYISTNPRRGEIALHCSGQENQLLPFSPEEVSLISVGQYLRELPDKLQISTQKAKENMEKARDIILGFRKEEYPFKEDSAESGDSPKRKEGVSEEDRRRYQQTESAHIVALTVVERGIKETKNTEDFFNPTSSLATILNRFIIQFEAISRRIHHVLEPAKHYVRRVVNRELSAKAGEFDPGELVFAAASFGATTDWKSNERLNRVCEMLVHEFPDSGSLPTRRPFHSTYRGYRLLPIGCEMTRNFAQLLQKTNYEFKPQLIQKMLTIFEEKLIKVPQSNQSDKECIAWNFEGAPDPDKPCVWVTAVAVLALDRIVRMLNQRINNIVLKHFEVISPEKLHPDLTLNRLTYPDYGFSEYRAIKSSKHSIAIHLELMRAHIMRVTLPEMDKSEEGKKKKIFSAILYGPPGTGKTTLVESLALSSNVPLIRLSPSDLTVQGQELIEARARSVFEALSMLTQAVIIFDEFEPVLGKRSPGSAKSGEQTHNFLLTGMLPKLVKLNEAAKKQSVVYCLATNHIETIDDAAKRIGRFDLYLPIYNPDPLSRAGTFLYRVQEYVATHNIQLRFNKDKVIKLLTMIERLAGVSASKLAEDFFKIEDSSPYLQYYLKEKPDRCPVEKRDTLKILDYKDKHLSKEEINDRKWLLEWEQRITEALSESGSYTPQKLLSYCLTPRQETRIRKEQLPVE